MTTGTFSRIFAWTPGDLAYPTHSSPDVGRCSRRSRQWEAGGLGGRTCPRACVPTITPHTPSPLDLYVRSSASLVPLARPAIARTHPDTPPDGDAGRDARGPDALRSATSTSERREALGRDARGPDALRSAMSTSERRVALGRDARGPDAQLVNHRREGFRTGGAPRPIAQPDCKTLRLARDRQETRGQRRVHEPGGGG